MSEDRARQGVEHLQTAALEVIAAVRAFLDVAEDLVRAAETAPEAAARTGANDEPTPRVTRIRIS